MRRKLLFLFILVTIPATAAIVASPQDKKEFIGYRHKGVVYGEILPNGARDLGGGLLSNQNYGVSRFTKGKKYMLWLEKIISRDARSGVPNWEVKDVLMFDNLKKNQEFLFSYSSGCRQNGKENLDLIVMAERKPKNSFKVLRAWRADTRREKFEKISDKGIVCREAEEP